MRNIQLLFSNQMALANVDGLKTETRRMRGLDFLNVRPDEFTYCVNEYKDGKLLFHFYDKRNKSYVTIKSPYGIPGDMLCMRENLAYDGIWKYSADGMALQGSPNPEEMNKLERYRNRHEVVPAVHMPKWCCRFRREILDISIERVQSITPAGVVAEGLPSGNVGEYCKLFIEIRCG